MALSRDAIVAAGLEILDQYGLGDLSMRRVADVLGVQAGALYYHVPNKQSLLAAVADEILARPAAAAPAEADVATMLTTWASTLRSALLAHRDAAELVASAHAFGLGGVDPTAQPRDILASAGMPNPAATMAALLHFVLGHVTEEQTRAQMQSLGLITDFDTTAADADFVWGIGLFVRGIGQG